MARRTKFTETADYPMGRWDALHRNLVAKHKADLARSMEENKHRPLGTAKIDTDRLVWVRPEHGKGHYDLAAVHPDLPVVAMRITITQNGEQLPDIDNIVNGEAK